MTTPGKVPRLKRGHNRDFSLTRKDRDILINTTIIPKTKAVLVLLANGWTSSEIVSYRAEEHLIDRRLYRPGEVELAYSEEDERLPLPYHHLKAIRRYTAGLGFTRTVTVWRRVKRALTDAHKRGDLYFPDPDKMPFPEALRFTKEEILVGKEHRQELIRTILRAIQDPDNVEIWREEQRGVRHLFIDIILDAE